MKKNKVVIVESIEVGTDMAVGVVFGKGFGRRLAYQVGQKGQWTAIETTVAGGASGFDAGNEETKGHLIAIGKHGLDNQAATDQEALAKASEVLEALVENIHEYLIAEVEELACAAATASSLPLEHEGEVVLAKAS